MWFMSKFSLRFHWLICWVLLLTSWQVLAQDKDGHNYESARVFAAMQKRGLVRDEHPEGKTIIAIEVDRHEVFERDELWPEPLMLANGFHALTDEGVVQRELTFGVGDRFSGRAVEETMRNLRRLQIFSLVRIEAVQTSDPNLIKIFVFTRDLWSLRLETAFAGAGSNLNFVGQLTERNFLGRNKLAAVRVGYRPITASFGQSYGDYRMFGKRLQLQEGADTFYNYETNRFEGAVVNGLLGRPFYRLDQNFSFDLYVQHRDWMHRDLEGVVPARIDLSDERAIDCDVSEASCVRSVYRERISLVGAAAHYRIGAHYKHTFTGGMGYGNQIVRARPESAVGAGYEQEFERYVLPLPRRSVFPFLRYRFFGTDYAKFRNLASFAVTETVLRGPSVDGSARLPLTALGSTYNALVLDGRLDYVWAEHDALLSLAVLAGVRREQREYRNQLVAGRVRAATPQWLLGRLVFNGLWEKRKNDTGRTFVSLGGANGLRGYSVGALYAYGASRVLSNVEYRTLPVDIASLHIGAVLFWDSGSVYGQGLPLQMRHGAGIGLRVLIPQLNVYPLSFDCGTAVGGASYYCLLSVADGQVVPMTAIEDNALLGAGEQRLWAVQPIAR